MEEMRPSKKPRVFYGYWVVLVAFLCLCLHSGGAVYVFSLFVKPLETDFGWGRGEIMAGFTVLFLVIAVTSPFTGRVVDRYGVRGVLAGGAFISGLGFALLSLINNLWSFYLYYAIIGVGMAALGPVAASAAVSNWFKKRRGTAIGIMSTGVGLGGFALAPLVGGYLIPSFGWRASYLALALLIWVIMIPLALLVMRTKPADMGLYPDGIEAPETAITTEAPPSAMEGLTLRMALATLAFWLTGVSYLVSCLTQHGVLQSQVPYLEDAGFPVVIAATALGAAGLVSAVSKFGFGWLCNWIPAKYAWCVSLGFQLAGIGILMSVGPASPLALIWLYVIIMGVGMGGWMPTLSMLVSTTFGLASYGVIFGMLYLFVSIGVASGPLMAGYMYDIMNTYHWVFIIFLALYAISLPAILAVRRPKSP